MSSTTTTSKPPPYGADTSISVFLHNYEVPPGDPFLKLVEETRQKFLSSTNILDYIASSTFADDPTPESQSARVSNIQDFLQNRCPIIVGIKTAAPDSGSSSKGRIQNTVGQAMGRECIYLDQDMIDCWAAKKCPPGRRLLLTFLLKLILFRELTISAWLIYGDKKPDSSSEGVRDSTPFFPPPDVWVSGCGHVFTSRRGKNQDLQSVVFLNDEGGYIDIPAVDTPVLRSLAAGDWSVFQIDVITSIGPYRKSNQKDNVKRVWAARCECTGLGSGNITI